MRRRRNIFPELDNYHNLLSISPEGSFSNPGGGARVDTVHGRAVHRRGRALPDGRARGGPHGGPRPDRGGDEGLQRLDAPGVPAEGRPPAGGGVAADAGAGARGSRSCAAQWKSWACAAGCCPPAACGATWARSCIWPVYEEAERLRCCLAVHGGSYPDLGFQDLNIFAAIHAMGHPFGITIAFTSMLFNGIFDSFPNVRYGFMEGGVGWFLMALERSDGSYNVVHTARPEPAIPAAARRRQTCGNYVLRHVREGRIFVGVEGDEPDLAHAVRTVGSEPFIWSSDFPHEVTVETCALEIRELVENEEVPDAALEAILWKNAAAAVRPARTRRQGPIGGRTVVRGARMAAGLLRSYEERTEAASGSDVGTHGRLPTKCSAVESVPGKLTPPMSLHRHEGCLSAPCSRTSRVAVPSRSSTECVPAGG